MLPNNMLPAPLCENMIWHCSGGSTYLHFGRPPPSSSGANFLHFNAVLGEIWPNNSLAPLCSRCPVWEILDMPLACLWFTWIFKLLEFTISIGRLQRHFLLPGVNWLHISFSVSILLVY